MISSFLFFMALSVISLNCNGIRDTSKRAGLLHWVHSLPVRPDIICLQEVHCSSVQECSSWFQSSGFGVVCSPGSVRSSGCAILFCPSLSLSGSWCDTEGRYLQCEFSFRDQSFRICCLYVPNRNPARDHFLDDLQAKIDLSVPSLDLLCGNFNTVFDRALDRRGSDPSDSSRESTSALRGLLDACWWWTFSGTCTRLHPGSRGPNGTVPLPRASTLSAFLPCGSLPSRPAPWCPVLFQITAGSRSLSRSLTSFPPVQACGNLTLPS